MRILAFILIIFLANMNGCVRHSFPMEKECQKSEEATIIDKLEANMTILYSTASKTRNAVTTENTVCLSGFSVRILPNRIHTENNANLRQVLLSTHKPVISRLIHLPANQLFAFSKEYHIFQLRRILI